MKTVEHVSPGQKIQASTINGLIDAVYGDQYTGTGHYRTTSNGVAVEPGVPLAYADLGISPDAWKVDPMTLKVTNAWLTIGEKSYGACLTKEEEKVDGKTVIDFYHQIDFGKQALKDGDLQGDYYIRISNTFKDDPENAKKQEDDDKKMFEDFYSDNTDEENKVNHYYDIQVVKDTRKNGDDSSLEDDHGASSEDCVYFKFFTIYGPHEGEKDEEGKQAKTLPPYDIHYYTRSFGGGFGEGDGLRPWKLRWMPQNDEDPSQGEWQIYMPTGCASINDTAYYPKNEYGTDANGDMTFQWFKIEQPQDADANVVTIRGQVYKEWTVYVHFRDFPLMYATTSQMDDNFEHPSDTITVGTLLLKEWTPEGGGQRQYVHKTQQIKFDYYKHTFENSGSFKIIFQVQGDRRQESSYKTFLTNQYIQFGLRAQAWIEEDTEITNMEDVVLDIDHSTEYVEISIIDDWQDNTMDHTYVRLLKMKDGTIVNDNRSSARKDWPFYAN